MINILFDKISSTQNIPLIIKKNIAYKNIYIIQSFKQINGVGRYNRKWHSPNGNIYFSIIFNYKYEFIPLMNTYVCYLLHFYIKNKYKILLDYKWPNDLYFNNKKVIGILTQNEITGSSCIYKIGIGINVNNKISNSDFKAITLNEILGIKFNLLDLSNSLQSYINDNIFKNFNSLSVVRYLNKYLIKNTASYSKHFTKNKINTVDVLSLNKDFSLKIIHDSLIKNINYGEIS